MILSTMHPNTGVTGPDGSLDFSGGVNSVKVTTIESARNPTGLKRNELAWLQNGTVRDGGITPRAGWQPLGKVHDGSALYQGGYMYDPFEGNPYLIIQIGGEVFRVDPDSAETPINLTESFAGTVQPSEVPLAFFTQAEEFTLCQAGDGVTLPLFWDGSTLRRSLGITDPGAAPGTPGVNEIPAATSMDYYFNRLWYAQGRQYSAGDVVSGPSGTPPYARRDAILNVTENPLVLGGDGFRLPANAGAIRALKHEINQDTALGQGRLLIFTRKAVHAQEVPVTRDDWIAATTDNMPRQTVVQQTNGSVNDRSLVSVNGDWFFQSVDPSIRSLVAAVRYFSTWGNIEIASNVTRVLQFNDRALLRFSSGIEFDNRLLQTALPRSLPQGVVHDALIPLDFTPISGFGEQRPPIWQGVYEGLQILQMFSGDFGGRERAFALIVSREDNSIQLWELSLADRFENGDNRVTMVTETPAYTWGDEFALKKLVSAELWFDRLYGTVQFTVEYRPDSDVCWKHWHSWKECSPKNSCEDFRNPICYPLTEHGESWRATKSLPLPTPECSSAMNRPANVGYQFQMRITTKGFVRLRGWLLHAEPVDRALYQNLVC